MHPRQVRLCASPAGMRDRQTVKKLFELFITIDLRMGNILYLGVSSNETLK